MFMSEVMHKLLFMLRLVTSSISDIPCFPRSYTVETRGSKGAMTSLTGNQIKHIVTMSTIWYFSGFGH